MPLDASSRDVTLPVKTELLKAMKLSENSPEGAEYLSMRAHEIVAQSKILNKTEDLRKMSSQVLAAIDEYAEFVRFKQVSSAKIWSGQLPETSDFKNMQSGIARQAMGDLMEKSFTGVRFDYAVSAQGHFVRGYGSTDGGAKPLETEIVESLDKLFNAWLAEKHEVATEGGYLFKTDAEGNRTRLNVDEVEELMADSAKEFHDYLQEKGNIELVGGQREYPGEDRLKALRRAAEERIEAIQSEEADDAGPSNP